MLKDVTHIPWWSGHPLEGYMCGSSKKAIWCGYVPHNIKLNESRCWWGWSVENASTTVQTDPATQCYVARVGHHTTVAPMYVAPPKQHSRTQGTVLAEAGCTLPATVAATPLTIPQQPLQSFGTSQQSKPRSRCSVAVARCSCRASSSLRASKFLQTPRGILPKVGMSLANAIAAASSNRDNATHVNPTANSQSPKSTANRRIG